MEKKKCYEEEALEYISRLAEGGLRDAISLMDKCLSFSTELTLENVVKALGTVDYDVMKELTDAVITQDKKAIIKLVEGIHEAGKDIKQFVNQYVKFLLDIQKYSLKCSKYMQIPNTKENQEWLEGLEKEDIDLCSDLLSDMVSLNSSIKWSQAAKYDLEACLLLFCDMI